MKICLISQLELRVLEVNGQLPCCSHHTHITPSDAVAGCLIDLYVPVGEEHGIWAVVEQASNDRTWKPTSSDGIEVQQLVSKNKPPRIPDETDPELVKASRINHKAYARYHERRTDHLQQVTRAKLVDVVEYLHEEVRVR